MAEITVITLVDNNNETGNTSLQGIPRAAQPQDSHASIPNAH